jgi:fructose-1,6-bisphosphatase I
MISFSPNPHLYLYSHLHRFVHITITITAISILLHCYIAVLHVIPVLCTRQLRPLTEMLLSIQLSCKTISNLINRAGLVYGNIADKDERYTMSDPKFAKDGRFYSMRRLDQLSTIVLKNALAFTGKVALVKAEPTVEGETPAEHQPGVLIAQALDSDYVAVLDPLDGSGNADAAICTGTVFGVFDKRPRGPDDDPNMTLQEELVKSVLQPAKRMKAAGYCLYSSATVLVFTLGEDVNGFTLDPQRNEFVLTHPQLTIPERGNVYSCNEGNSEGWQEDFKDYLKALKTGKNQSERKYAHRYVGSMVGDIHRTLSYGGIFCYPADSETHPEGNLQLLYKSAPMAFVVSKAGGRAIDGRSGDLLDVKPDRVHQKSPCFMGSPMDVNELECYL